MSQLAEMNNRLKKRTAAINKLKAINDEFRSLFPVGGQVEFDRGDMRMVGGVVVSNVDDDRVAIRPHENADVGYWLFQANGLVFVPWALLFTLEAAKEMHEARDHLLERRANQ